MKFCGGIDLGGTKIEARLFDHDLNEINRLRIETPTADYAILLDAIEKQILWLDKQAPNCPIGLASAGLIEHKSRKIFAANLPFDQQYLEKDIKQRFGRLVHLINDSNAFSLSEAHFKEMEKYDNVIGLIIGTGVSAGQVFSKKIFLNGANGQWGEIGHIPLTAGTAKKYDLPLIPCGCGQLACFETLLSGPGLVKLTSEKFGIDATTYEIFSDEKFQPILDIWFDILTDLLAILVKTNDPEVIVFGGGLGALPFVPERATKMLDDKLLPGLTGPKLLTAKGGDASGARGAAIYALNSVLENN